MTDKNRPEKIDSLKKYLWISVAFHCVVLILFSGIFDFRSDEIILPQAMKVDIIGQEDLPTKQQSPPPPAQPEKPPAPQPEPEPEPEKTLPVKEEKKAPEAPKVNLEEKKKKEREKKKKEAEKKKKKEQKEKREKEKQAKKLKNQQEQALNKLKQKEALDKLKDTAPSDTEEEPQPIKGNRITPGTFSAGLDAIQFNKYYDGLKTHLKNNWSLPGWLAELDLKAEALVALDSRGYVIRREIIKSSGNPNFDNTILAAIDRSSPFPLPPERLSSRLENTELVFGFPGN